MDVSDSSSSTQVKLSRSTQNQLTLSYMQAITPTLALGGQGDYTIEKKEFTSAFGGLYDDRSNQFAVIYDKEVSINIVHVILVTD